jgi:flagellar motor switch protein FliM
MEERLTQDEIDTLLAALSSGDIQPSAVESGSKERAHKVKPYDFRRPEKFSKEHLRTIQILHENFARLWSNALGGLLRQPVQMTILGVEQMTYDEFTLDLPNPTILVTFGLSPLEGLGLLEISVNLGFPMFERLLGGTGTGTAQSRELTTIEKRVMGSVAEDGLVMLKEAWGKLVEVEPAIGTVESNPQFVSIATPTDIVLVVSIEVQIGTLTGMVNVLYTYVMLEPIVSYLSAKSLIGVTMATPDQTTQERVQEFLDRVPVPIIVELGHAHLTLRDIMELDLGDLIKLDTRTDHDARVFVEGRLKYLGVPGKSRGNLAVKISHIVNNQEDWEN